MGRDEFVEKVTGLGYGDHFMRECFGLVGLEWAKSMCTKEWAVFDRRSPDSESRFDSESGLIRKGRTM